MGINEFFKTILGARVALLYSWGAVDDRNRRVFLRVWDGPKNIDASSSEIVVFDKNNRRSKSSHNERERHLELAKAGYRLYGVLCKHSGNSDPKAAKISSFDAEQILLLGMLTERANGLTYAKIDGQVRTDDLLSTPEFLDDLAALKADSSLSITTRAALIQARLGQGIFRKKLFARHNNACALTGCNIYQILRASHIKPWAKSDNRERLDVNNGLLLTANIDALFDAGLISFEGDGSIIISPRLLKTKPLIVSKSNRLQTLPSKYQLGYLEYHRETVYLGSQPT